MATYILTKLPLFSGMTENDVEALLDCTGARMKTYEKDGILIWEGTPVTELGVVLSGRALSTKTDADGKKVIVSVLEPGNYIAILLAASYGHLSPVTVEAQTDVTVLFLSLETVIRRCGALCVRHDRLIRNVFDGIAQKALSLHERTECLTHFSIRGRVMTYLRQIARQQQTKTLTLPLDRNGMAEYLAVDRSALSRELSRMQREGVIEFYKNSFRILGPQS